jgi:hypothetical protein
METAAAEITALSRDRRARVAAYGGIVAAYLAAAHGDPFTPFQLALFAAAAAWSLGFEVRFRKFFFSSPIKIGLIVVGSAIFVMFVTGSSHGTGEQFANSIARFLFWNAVVFVLSRNKSEYDLWTMAIIELSLFMISGAFIQPPEFVPLLLASVACFLYTFQRVAVLRCGPAGEAERGGLGLTIWTLLIVLEAGAFVFIAFPRRIFRETPKKEGRAEGRIPRPPPGDPVATGGDRTGIPRQAEFMTLTHFERLKLDTRPVLRVRITTPDQRPVPPEQTLYLRGAVLDTYEDGKWKATFDRQTRRDADDGAEDGWTSVERAPPPGRAIVRQHIRATPLAGDLSFALPDPVRVGWREARYDPAGILFFPAPPRQLAEYDVESALMPIDVPRVSRRTPPPPRYLQLPPGLDSLRELARKQEAREDRLHAKVAGFVRYLMRNGFTYRLGPFVPAEGKDPVEHFLEKREGYCVHYASALALLCRASGVPARIATGFQLSDPQEDGTFLVRNSDAHAWVEVWFGPEHGWRPYDATPPESRGPGPLPGGDPVATVENRKPETAPDGTPSRWDRFIVDFDPALQGKAARETLRAIAGAALAVLRFLVSPPVVGTLSALAGIAFLAYLLLPGRQRNRLRQIASGFREPTTVDFYRDFLWALSRRGLRKAPWLTAVEFASQARLRFDDPGIDFVTDRFCRARYRATPPTPEERRKIDEIIERLRTTRPQESGK